VPSEVISDDHAHDRVLTTFCRMTAIHALTIIAHHCSILIITGPQGNAKPSPQALRGSTGLPRGNTRKSANPGGRIGRMEGIGANSRKPLREIASVVTQTIIAARLIIFNHHDQSCAKRRGRP
jgi:hypothetical protein